MREEHQGEVRLDGQPQTERQHLVSHQAEAHPLLAILHAREVRASPGLWITTLLRIFINGALIHLHAMLVHYIFFGVGVQYAEHAD